MTKSVLIMKVSQHCLSISYPTLEQDRQRGYLLVKAVFPYIGIKSLFSSKYIILLVLVYLQIEGE